MPATTFAELFGATFPTPAQLEDGVIVGPTGTEIEGTAVFGSGGSATITPATLADMTAQIVASLTAVKPDINACSSGTKKSMTVGDTWKQSFDVAASAADKLLLMVKENLGDSDDDAVIAIDSDVGLTRVNKAVHATATDGSLTVGTATADAVLASKITLLITPKTYFLVLKQLDAGDDRTWFRTTKLIVNPAGVLSIST